MEIKIEVPSTGIGFKNNASYCVGTGRMGLSLQKEFLDHLKMVQKAIHFRYIRGHGLFCDDTGIYREITVDGKTQTFYNFTYLDRIIDSYIEHDIRPFLELGFMPEKLKSGEQTVFYWKGNVTPPQSYEKWADLIKNTLTHLIERYGREEVITWPIEVWNEPNISFWAGTMEEYFKLYDYSAKAAKQVDSRIQVGGPAICGVETEKWLRAFFEYCIHNNSPLDFISRHCYTANPPTKKGHYSYHSINDPVTMINELKETREIMASYPTIKNMPLHITEFNSSYNPDCPVHDTDFHAPYIARILSEAGDYADSYSYWTLSDVFEEFGVPPSVFHGGFGLVAFNNIKKPTFHAFEFFSQAGKELLFRDDHVVVTKKNNSYVLIAWNWQDLNLNIKAKEISYIFTLPTMGKQAIVVKKDVGGSHANPLQTWSNLGKPYTLTKEQVKILHAAAEPLQTDEKIFEKNGVYEVSLQVPSNHLIMIEITPVVDQTNSYLGFNQKEFYGLR
ncbi:MAG TPA: hypothetical protein VJ861_05630 [Treponemataceae bacterium]|nr:hypothetical protein [Treponemataceae bacterium]